MSGVSLYVNARSALDCGSEAAALASDARTEGGSWRYRTPRRLRRSFAGFALVMWAATCVGQENPCLTRTVTVSVFNAEDEPVRSLDAAHFRGKIQGGNIEITSAKYDGSPHRLLFLVDASAAMTRDQAKWRSELAMAEGLISWMPAQAPVALLTFANPQPEKIDFSQGREAVNTALARLEASSGAGPSGAAENGLSDAMTQALAMLGEPHPGDVICLIADMSGDWSPAQKNDAEQKMLAGGARLFGFLPESALATGGAAATDSIGAAALRDLIEATGGDYLIFSSTPIQSAAAGATDLTPQDRNKLLVASRSFAQEMTESYILHIKLPHLAEGGSEWTLEAVGSGKGKESQWRVVYPKRLGKCP